MRITPCDFCDKTYKSRVGYAKVEQIVDNDRKEYNEAESFVFSDKEIKYQVGQIVNPNGFNKDPNVGCAQGISVHRDYCDIWRQNMF